MFLFPRASTGAGVFADEVGAEDLFAQGVEGAGHMFGRFVTVQTADDHPSKPHPSMVEAALGEAGGETAQTVMIGDTTFDVEMACAAGVTAIGVSWGYHPVGALRDAGASAVLSDYRDLVPYLTKTGFLT